MLDESSRSGLVQVCRSLDITDLCSFYFIEVLLDPSQLTVDWVFFGINAIKPQIRYRC